MAAESGWEVLQKFWYGVCLFFQKGLYVPRKCLHLASVKALNAMRHASPALFQAVYSEASESLNSSLVLASSTPLEGVFFYVSFKLLVAP